MQVAPVLADTLAATEWPDSPGLEALGLRALLLLLLLGALLWGLRWLQTRRLGGVPAARRLQVLEALSLGGRRQLALVRAGERVLLLGISDHGVRQLERFGEDEARALVEGAQGRDFASIFRRSERRES